MATKKPLYTTGGTDPISRAWNEYLERQRKSGQQTGGFASNPLSGPLADPLVTPGRQQEREQFQNQRADLEFQSLLTQEQMKRLQGQIAGLQANTTVSPTQKRTLLQEYNQQLSQLQASYQSQQNSLGQLIMNSPYTTQAAKNAYQQQQAGQDWQTWSQSPEYMQARQQQLSQQRQSNEDWLISQNRGLTPEQAAQKNAILDRRLAAQNYQQNPQLRLLDQPQPSAPPRTTMGVALGGGQSAYHQPSYSVHGTLVQSRPKGQTGFNPTYNNQGNAIPGMIVPQSSSWAPRPFERYKIQGV